MAPNPWGPFAYGLLRVAIVSVALTACSGKGQGGDGESSSRAMVPVTVVALEEAEVGAVSELLVSNASVESELQADVLPRTTGIVREVMVGEGDAVQRGQVLAVLDNVSIREGATRASANVARLQVQLDQARELLAAGAGSKQEVVELEGQLRDARSSGREARDVAGNSRLVAPFEGVVAMRDVKVGDMATSSKRAFLVVDLDKLRVVASLPERDVGRVRVGQSATLIAAYDSELRSTGSVSRISPVIDSGTGTFRVTIDLDPDQRSLRPGQFVGVELEVDRHEGVVTVAKKAVVYEDGKPVVYRMIDRPPEEEGEDEEAKEDKEAPSLFGISFDAKSMGKDEDADARPPSPFVSERVPVELGLVDNATAEIIKGIRVGDKVIVLGQSNLRDGAPVKTAAMIEADEVDESAKDSAEGEDAAEGSAG